MSDAAIQKKYGLTNGQFYYKKGEWGLVKSRDLEVTTGIGQPADSTDVKSNKKNGSAWADLKNQFVADKAEQAVKVDRINPSRPPFNETEKKLVSAEAFNKSEEALSLAIEKIRKLESLKEVSETNLNSSRSKLDRLHKLRTEDVECIDQLKAEIASLKEVGQNPRVEYQAPENKMITENEYQELVEENRNLKKGLDHYKEYSFKLLSQLSLSNTQYGAIKEQLENLRDYEEKYYATSRALKLHLPIN